MKLADGIRKHGFRKWYERELLTGHAHLALLLFCALGLMLAIEASTRFRDLQDQLIDLFAVAACTSAGLWALRRYIYVLTHAEAVANQADCPQCKTYGRMDLLAPAATPPTRAVTGPDERAKAVEDDEGEFVAVRCRHCAHAWRIFS